MLNFLKKENLQFKEMRRRIFSRILSEVGWEKRDTDGHTDALLRNMLIGINLYHLYYIAIGTLVLGMTNIVTFRYTWNGKYCYV